ncbi:nitronate monooxygenase [Amphritea atlantica]|uniref:Nitronate monooxygenase n=1 Tax=Amphritea atlantica TaxID=355243 RepID=A0A1H9KEQ8_9GAMM|nr:nitronate monooxygenase [Amphritea atlantica]SEQ97568.1 nitronate monooxygenase [Amphritea atlantica]
MSIQQEKALFSRLKLPMIVAPMFLVSSPELVIASSKSGVIGSLPAANARTVETLNEWMAQVHGELNSQSLPWLFNMIVHSSYDRFDAEIELVRKYQPAIVSTALGSPKRVMEVVKSYGGKVYADVITPGMAKKSADAGVDGLILVTQGAGGHTGRYNPLAFIAEVRQFWDGPLGIAGCISHGSDVAAMLVAGADFVASGTRYIAATESFASDEYKQMLVDTDIEGVVETKAVSGVLANWMQASLDKAGIDPDASNDAKIDFSGNISTANKAWKDVWSAGQGVGSTTAIESATGITERFYNEFTDALKRSQAIAAGYLA